MTAAIVQAKTYTVPPPSDPAQNLARTVRALMDALEPLTIAAIDEATRLRMAAQFETISEDHEFALKLQAEHWDAMAAAGTAALAKAAGDGH